MCACSALRRRYRDRLGSAAPSRFVLLDVALNELARRLRERENHFMPATLLASQLHTLEPLALDEDGVAVAARDTVKETVAAIRAALRQPRPMPGLASGA